MPRTSSPTRCAQPAPLSRTRGQTHRLPRLHHPTIRGLRVRTDDPQELLKATGDLADMARQTGNVQLAVAMDEQLRQLRAGARLSPDQQARASVDIRATGRLPKSQP